MENNLPAEAEMEDHPFTARSIKKMATRIEGLDRVLKGGIPGGHVTTLSGGPGSGKSMLSLEILYRNAKAGKNSILISFEETASHIRGNALSMGWDLPALEKAGRVALIHPDLDPNALRAGDFTTEGLIAIMEGKAAEINAEFVAVDALDVLLRLYVDAEQQRQEYHSLYQWITTRNMTGLLTVKLQQSLQSGEKYDFLDYMADCVVYLDQRVSGQIATRRLRVIKYRGSGYSSNEHPFIITPEGIVLMPITATELNYRQLGALVPSGHEQIDRILGGGYRKGATILISGPTGSGKTSFASMFAKSACQRGERVQYVSYEESPETQMDGMRSLGIELAPCADSKLLKYMSAMPEAVGVEQHLHNIFRSMDQFDPAHHIVDAVSAAVRMGSEKAAFDFMVRLMDECKKRGITCIFTNQTSSRSPLDEISGIGISSLIDTAIILDYDLNAKNFSRYLFVLKSRGVNHSQQKHHFEMTEDGVTIIDPPAEIRKGGDSA